MLGFEIDRLEVIVCSQIPQTVNSLLIEIRQATSLAINSFIGRHL